jgi:uncharacterized protein (DUF1697 family)
MMTAPKIALLRAVNLAGRNKVAMADLRAMAEALGFAAVQTLLQSGNLVFADPKSRSPAELESLLERETKKRLGIATDFIVRATAEWSALIKRNPFPAEAIDDPGHLLLMPTKGGAIGKSEIADLRGAIVGRERVEALGRDLFIVYPDGVGRSRLTTALIERKLGGRRGTARNWNTVLKIAALLGE